MPNGSPEPEGADIPWVRAHDALWHETAQRVVVLPPAASDPLLLSGTASWVWHLLASPRTLQHICMALAEEFQIPVDDIRADVKNALDALVASGAAIPR